MRTPFLNACGKRKLWGARMSSAAWRARPVATVNAMPRASSSARVSRVNGEMEDDASSNVPSRSKTIRSKTRDLFQQVCSRPRPKRRRSRQSTTAAPRGFAAPALGWWPAPGTRRGHRPIERNTSRRTGTLHVTASNEFERALPLTFPQRAHRTGVQRIPIVAVTRGARHSRFRARRRPARNEPTGALAVSNPTRPRRGSRGSGGGRRRREGGQVDTLYRGLVFLHCGRTTENGREDHHGCGGKE